MRRLGLLVAAAALAGCGSNGTGGPQAMGSLITFQLQNSGLSTVYLFQSCQIDFTITSLADPVHPITREGPCGCQCGSACPVCGPCFQGAREVATGTMITDYWNTVSVTNVPTSTGSCEQKTVLPDGPYRIDVPVYPTAEDAAAGTFARTAIQSFDLPVAGGVVDVQLGQSP